MKKLSKLITTADSANEIFHRLQPSAAALPGNNARLYKVKMPDDCEKPFRFVWSIYTNASKQAFYGIRPENKIMDFSASDIIPWDPYNEEKIGSFFKVAFTKSQELYLETVPLLDGEEALKLLQKEHPALEGNVNLCRAEYLTDSKPQTKSTGLFWVVRDTEYYYAGIGVHTRRTGYFFKDTEIKAFYYPGTLIEEKYLLFGNQDFPALRPI